MNFNRDDQVTRHLVKDYQVINEPSDVHQTHSIFTQMFFPKFGQKLPLYFYICIILYLCFLRYFRYLNISVPGIFFPLWNSLTWNNLLSWQCTRQNIFFNGIYFGLVSYLDKIPFLGCFFALWKNHLPWDNSFLGISSFGMLTFLNFLEFFFQKFGITDADPCQSIGRSCIGKPCFYDLQMPSDVVCFVCLLPF